MSKPRKEIVTGNCSYCTETQEIEPEHVVPRSIFVHKNQAKIVIDACHQCNNEKSGGEGDLRDYLIIRVGVGGHPDIFPLMKEMAASTGRGISKLGLAALEDRELVIHRTPKGLRVPMYEEPVSKLGGKELNRGERPEADRDDVCDDGPARSLQRNTRSIMYRFTVPVLVVAVVVLGALGVSIRPSSAAQEATPASAPTSHPFAGETAWIAYYSGAGIGLIHPDGTDDHQVAADAVPGEELLADWSPDGTRLVFTTRGGEVEPIYEYELATERSHQLFACEDPCIGDDEPVYAPDGKRVAFERALAPFVPDTHQGGEVPSDCGLWIGELSSGEVTQITSNTDPPCDREYEAHWSPDGMQLTYWRDPHENGRPTGTAVFTINADGTDEQRLTDPAMFAGSPDWSPDGEWIVFSTYPLHTFQCCQVSNLYRMHPDGSGVEQLTHYPTEDLRATQPRYTPDGQWIVFTSVTPETRSLWVIPAGGGEPIVLAPGGIYTHGTWQPTPGKT